MALAHVDDCDPEADAERARWLRNGPVLIVGGGIGGLATALALATRQIPSIVLERRPTPSEDGAGIQIGPNGTAILNALGVAAQLQPHVAVPRAIRVHDARDGLELARLPLGGWIEQRHGSPYWVAHRQDLHAALVARVRAEPLIGFSQGADFAHCVRWGGEGVHLHTADGRNWHGCALIAADGLWSTVRLRHFHVPTPRATGHRAVRATIAVDQSLLTYSHDVFVWMHPEGHVVHYPVRAGREIAVVGIFRDRDGPTGWSSPIGQDWVSRRSAIFPFQVRQLFAAAADWRAWSLNELPRAPSWVDANIALLGDAAHPILPFLAQGAVMALEDAVVLAETLAGHDDVPGALHAYAHRRRGRVRRVAAASQRNGRIYHATGAMAGARNIALRRISGERLMGRYDWVYGWRA